MYLFKLVTGLLFTIWLSNDLDTLPATLFPKNLPVSWTTFWKQFSNDPVLCPIIDFHICYINF